jgi:aminoglycoside phosphotransferase (APT) family kinase protein
VPPWDPEHAVDAALARRLVRARWPDLADLEPVVVGSGWDVDVWRFGDLTVRFPRRTVGVRCLENELLVLPHLVDRLPLPVPRPLRIGEPAVGFPARFDAHAYLSGATAIRARLDDGALALLAAPLGCFLRAVHAVPLAPLYAAGLRDDDRGDAARIAGRGREWLGKLALPAALRDRIAAVLAAPTATDVASTLVHADFHAGNLLVDEDGAISAVIDWGDCAAGDPAIDLAIGLSLVPPHARSAFLIAHGDVTPATWARARLGAVARPR